MSTPAERYEFVTALRGIAAFAVLALHTQFSGHLALPNWLAPFVYNGGLGVMLFYLLSAFTLCLSMSRRDEPVAHFYIRRFFRIAPLFYAMTVAYLCVFGARPLWLVVTNLTFLFNLIPKENAFDGIVWAGWSVSVEVLFYAVFPFIFIAFARNLKAALALYAVTFLISFVFRGALDAGMLAFIGVTPRNALAFSVESLFTNLPFFMAGIVAFQLFERLRAASPAPDVGYALLVIAAVGLLTTTHGADHFLPTPITLRGVSSVWFGALVLGLALCPTRVLVNGATIRFGTISYSVYLVHFLVVWNLVPAYSVVCTAVGGSPLVGYGACLLLTLGCVTVAATVCYFALEKPGIRLGRALIDTLAARRRAVAV